MPRYVLVDHRTALVYAVGEWPDPLTAAQDCDRDFGGQLLVEEQQYSVHGPNDPERFAFVVNPHKLGLSALGNSVGGYHVLPAPDAVADLRRGWDVDQTMAANALAFSLPCVAFVRTLSTAKRHADDEAVDAPAGKARKALEHSKAVAQAARDAMVEQPNDA